VGSHAIINQLVEKEIPVYRINPHSTNDVEIYDFDRPWPIDQFKAIVTSMLNLEPGDIVVSPQRYGNGLTRWAFVPYSNVHEPWVEFWTDQTDQVVGVSTPSATVKNARHFIDIFNNYVRSISDLSDELKSNLGESESEGESDFHVNPQSPDDAEILDFDVALPVYDFKRLADTFKQLSLVELPVDVPGTPLVRWAFVRTPSSSTSTELWISSDGKVVGVSGPYARHMILCLRGELAQQKEYVDDLKSALGEIGEAAQPADTIARTIIKLGEDYDGVYPLIELNEPYPKTSEIIALVKSLVRDPVTVHSRGGGVCPLNKSRRGLDLLFYIPYTTSAGWWLTAWGRNDTVMALGDPGSSVISTHLIRSRDERDLFGELGSCLGEGIEDDFERQADLLANPAALVKQIAADLLNQALKGNPEWFDNKPWLTSASGWGACNRLADKIVQAYGRGESEIPEFLNLDQIKSWLATMISFDGKIKFDRDGKIIREAISWQQAKGTYGEYVMTADTKLHKVPNEGGHDNWILANFNQEHGTSLKRHEVLGSPQLTRRIGQFCRARKVLRVVVYNNPDGVLAVDTIGSGYDWTKAQREALEMLAIKRELVLSYNDHQIIYEPPARVSEARKAVDDIVDKFEQQADELTDPEKVAARIYKDARAKHHSWWLRARFNNDLGIITDKIYDTYPEARDESVMDVLIDLITNAPT